MYTSVVSSFLFPLHERLKRHTSVAVRREMEAEQWRTREKIEAAALARLRRLLVEAGVHVPYYRGLFEKLAFEPAKVVDLGDLRRLPFLTKTLIRANAEALKHDHAQDLRPFSTGGSSGEPLTFFVGPRRVSHDVAAKWRATRWWGVDIGDPEVVVWGSPIELDAQDRVRRLRDALLRSELLPAFEMSEPNLDAFVAAIRRRRPRMLFGYPSSLSYIARHAERRGVAMNDLGIEVAFVTSERLYDDQRDAIARTFGCRVANGYGGRDAGFIAHECPEGGMHITADDIVVELVDRAGHPVADGLPGEIVVTHLATIDYPVRPLPNRRYRRARYRALPVWSRPAAAQGNPGPQHGLRRRCRRHRDAWARTRVCGARGARVVSFKVVQESRQRTAVQLVVDETFEPSRTPASWPTFENGWEATWMSRSTSSPTSRRRSRESSGMSSAMRWKPSRPCGT
jgi:phenylacetate-CoA ligase